TVTVPTFGATVHNLTTPAALFLSGCEVVISGPHGSVMTSVISRDFLVSVTLSSQLIEYSAGRGTLGRHFE
ncbi:MAG: hypothetical protein DRJ61_15925, partial [Acidobacteria bacterium]